MTYKTAPRFSASWLMAGSPSADRAQNFDQIECSTDLDPLTTQVMLSVAVPLYQGDIVTNITFKSGATDIDTPVSWWFALYSSAATPALLGQTEDQADTDWPENTVMTVALEDPVQITATGVYYAGVMCRATDMPSLIGRTVGIAGAAASILGSKVLAQTSGSGLTTTAPATIASPTTVATVPLVILT